MHKFKFLSLILVALLCSSITIAEQKKTIPGYDIHYMAFSTSMLTPEIAKSYRIQRSKTRGTVATFMCF